MMKNDILNKIIDKITSIMNKKENLSSLAVWFENCLKFDVLRKNLKILKIDFILQEFLVTNEKNSSFDLNLIANFKKTLDLLEEEGN